MKAYLWISGVIFALFAAMHFVIAYEHWHRPASDPWSGLGPALMGRRRAHHVGVHPRSLEVGTRRVRRGSRRP